ncbi:hypothetical protein P7C71_g5399, partial [Lecanoromycetidae sp. Uapishka_2]
MDFWRFLGYARTSFHSHTSSITLPIKDNSTKPTTLLDFCKSITPICRLNPFLFNGHLQTFWTAVKSYDVPIYYKRHIFSAEDPAFAGTFAVDFVIAADEAVPYQEFRQNPFAVLCTTSLGGHLSWFETGGGRWFAKPASQFLIKLAQDINLQGLNDCSLSDGAVNKKDPAFFNPMRRKLHVPSEI